MSVLVLSGTEERSWMHRQYQGVFERMHILESRGKWFQRPWLVVVSSLFYIDMFCCMIMCLLLLDILIWVPCWILVYSFSKHFHTNNNNLLPKWFAYLRTGLSTMYITVSWAIRSGDWKIILHNCGNRVNSGFCQQKLNFPTFVLLWLQHRFVFLCRQYFCDMSLVCHVEWVALLSKHAVSHSHRTHTQMGLLMGLN